MTNVIGEELYSKYLDIVVDACRRHQQARLEMLLPGAVFDAEYNQVLDERLVLVMLSLANSFVADGSIDKARKLYKDLIQLKKSIRTYEPFDNFAFEQLALQNVSVRSQQQTQNAWSNLVAKVRNLIPFIMPSARYVMH
ncbi:MAG: hypothetical protein P4L53_19825 [Candidatus Obscuribacterales bacterium]|nr:hypothetical protein [Candidatus Obscuribacterales bacterium]